MNFLARNQLLAKKTKIFQKTTSLNKPPFYPAFIKRTAKQFFDKFQLTHSPINTSVFNPIRILLSTVNQTKVIS